LIIWEEFGIIQKSLTGYQGLDLLFNQAFSKGIDKLLVLCHTLLEFGGDLSKGMW
jgi:hypothetical protein